MAHVYLYLPELKELLPTREYDEFVRAFLAIPAFASQLSSGKHKYPSVHLQAMTDTDLDTLTQAVETLAGLNA